MAACRSAPARLALEACDLARFGCAGRDPAAKISHPTHLGHPHLILGEVEDGVGTTERFCDLPEVESGTMGPYLRPEDEHGPVLPGRLPVGPEHVLVEDTDGELRGQRSWRGGTTSCLSSRW